MIISPLTLVIPTPTTYTFLPGMVETLTKSPSKEMWVKKTSYDRRTRRTAEERPKEGSLQFLRVHRVTVQNKPIIGGGVG